jgi:hypothetical protein
VCFRIIWLHRCDGFHWVIILCVLWGFVDIVCGVYCVSNLVFSLNIFTCFGKCSRSCPSLVSSPAFCVVCCALCYTNEMILVTVTTECVGR